MRLFPWCCLAAAVGCASEVRPSLPPPEYEPVVVPPWDAGATGRDEGGDPFGSAAVGDWVDGPSNGVASGSGGAPSSVSGNGETSSGMVGSGGADSARSGQSVGDSTTLPPEEGTDWGPPGGVGRGSERTIVAPH